jgi:colicin import membrane protein
LFSPKHTEKFKKSKKRDALIKECRQKFGEWADAAAEITDAENADAEKAAAEKALVDKVAEEEAAQKKAAEEKAVAEKAEEESAQKKAAQEKAAEEGLAAVEAAIEVKAANDEGPSVGLEGSWHHFF